MVGETAKITTAFAKVGLSGDYGGTYYLTKLIGSAKARELYLLSPILSGKEAHAIGMMTRCVADADVVKAATEMAMQLAKGPTITLGYIKRNINNAEKLVDRSLLRRRGDRPLPLRRDRRPQGSGRRLRAEARAGVCEQVSLAAVATPSSPGLNPGDPAEEGTASLSGMAFASSPAMATRGAPCPTSFA